MLQLGFFCKLLHMCMRHSKMVIHMAEIIPFQLREPVNVNFDIIHSLFLELGAEYGMRVFERALFEISDRLCRLEVATDQKDLHKLRRMAKSLCFLCPRVGLMQVAQIADSILQAIAQGNLSVLPVLCRRILYLGEASLFHLENIPKTWVDL